jgi:3-mercaptopyruvate sulfurtransferase SseA
VRSVAARAAVVLYLMGFDRVGLHGGALGQWASDAANPMEVGP